VIVSCEITSGYARYLAGVRCDLMNADSVMQNLRIFGNVMKIA
jgi:hypothetical protein